MYCTVALSRLAVPCSILIRPLIMTHRCHTALETPDVPCHEPISCNVHTELVGAIGGIENKCSQTTPYHRGTSRFTVRISPTKDTRAMCGRNDPLWRNRRAESLVLVKTRQKAILSAKHSDGPPPECSTPSAFSLCRVTSRSAEGAKFR